MRNLKRALSLTLASVMLLGMMVVGSSAAGFPDVDENDNVEAIEVLNAVEVILGYDNGDFGPDDLVTRAQMAVIMAKLLNLDYQYYESTCPFNDVPAWARGYVGACYAKGIVSGYNATTYGANDGITPVQAASMMMRALGYFKYAEDYSGGFELSTVSKGTDIGIFEGVGSSATAQMTRNQVAKMALNALESEMVTFTGTPGMEVNGVTVGYRPEYTFRTSTEAKYQAIERRTSDVQGGVNLNRGQYYVQLGEELYNGDLRLNDNDRDPFQRPARTWEYKGKQIGTYVKEELLRKAYTDKVTGRDLYDLLTANTISTYDFVIAFDGETDNTVLSQVTGANQNPYFTQGNLVRTNTETIGRTGKGVLTEVYVDSNTTNPTVYIAIINTYAAKAREDYNTRDEDIDLTVYGVDFVASNTALVKDTTDSDGSKSGKQPFTEVLSPAGEDFELLKDAKKDDIYLVHVAEGEIQEIIVPEILSAVNLTAFSKGSYVVTGGEQYDYDNTALYDPEVLDYYTSTNGGNINLKDLTYNVILDEYGYLIGVERIEDPTQYVFITGTNGGYSDLDSAKTDMRAIFTDGTTDVISVNMVKSDATVRNTFRNMGPIINTWCTYTVDTNGVYTLRAVPTSIGTGKIAQWAQNAYTTANNGSTAGTRGTSSYTIDKGHVTLVGNNGTSDIRVYGNDKTIYISAEMTIINARTALKSGTGSALTSTGNGLTDGIGYGGADTNDTNYVVGAAVGTNPRTAIINDVDSVTVGVANANIKAVSLLEADLEKELDNGERTADTPDNLVFPKNEIYTLYNSDGVVIAAVVLGDDQGTSTKIATFTTDEPSLETFVEESDNTRAVTTNGYWTWSREAIIDGEVVTLTEKGDNLSQLAAWDGTNGHAQGDTAEIRFDADGNVRRADNLTKLKSSNTSGAKGVFTNGVNKYTTDITMVEQSAENDDTVILYEDFTSGSHRLVYSNGTLFRDNTNTKGVYVNGANVIVANAKLKDNAKGTPGRLADVDQYKTISRTYTGTDAMSDALNAMDNNFTGYLIIVVQDHVAKSVILNNTYGKKVNTGNTDKTDLDETTKVWRSGTTFDVEYYDANYGTDKALTSTQVRDLCANAISEYFNGTSVKYGTWSDLSLSGKMYLDDGSVLGEEITVNAKRLVAIYVDNDLNGYLRAGKGSSTLGTNAATTGENTRAVTGNFLIGKKAATAADSVNGASVNVTATSGDIYLTTAYKVTLSDTITATYTELADATSGNAGGAINTGTAYFIAKDTELTLKLTGKSDSKTYQFQADTPNDPTNIGDGAVLATSTDELTANYKVTSAADTTITAASGTAITIVNGKDEYDMVVDADNVTFQDLAVAAHVVTGGTAKYLVDLDPTVTGASKGSDASTLTNKPTTFLVSGHKYEFGYYKVTMPSDITTLGDTNTVFTNGAISWAVAGVTTPANDGVYFLKPGGTVVATVTADTITAKVPGGATVTGGTGAKAEVVQATNVPAGDNAATTLTVDPAGGVVVKMNNNTDTFNNVKLAFTWTVSDADIAASVLTVTAASA